MCEKFMKNIFSKAYERCTQWEVSNFWRFILHCVSKTSGTFSIATWRRIIGF